MPQMLLIVEPVGQRAERGLEGGQKAYQAMLDYGDELKAAGILLATSALGSASTRLQVRDGQERLLDGPFAEAREMVGGFFLIDCASREEALAWARRCPAAAFATIEVRETGPCYT